MSENNIAQPFIDTYWVLPGQFLAGEYPTTHNQDESRMRLTKLLEIGIRCIVDLTWPGDDRPYDALLKDVANENRIETAYLHRPIPDLAVPTKADLILTLNLIDEALENQRPVYVHCLGGVGRTGTIVGCYLVRHGMEGPQALERINLLRKDTPGWWYPSPETPVQVETVRDWKIGD
ncbi:MAG TPA: dual specificity protein phosphatase family protein [Longilinea sp.]|nr:dual specificity protein phosphatase family protein [Longilinea sp.]